VEAHESQLLILEDNVQKPCQEIHALAVLHLRVEEGVGLQDVSEDIGIQILVLGEGPLDIHVYHLIHVLVRLGFQLEGFVVPFVEVQMQDALPDMDPFGGEAVDLRIEEGLLVDPVGTVLVGKLVQTEQLDQGSIFIDVLYAHGQH